jgi:hypothetical protein
MEDRRDYFTVLRHNKQGFFTLLLGISNGGTKANGGEA